MIWYIFQKLVTASRHAQMEKNMLKLRSNLSGKIIRCKGVVWLVRICMVLKGLFLYFFDAHWRVWICYLSMIDMEALDPLNVWKPSIDSKTLKSWFCFLVKWKPDFTVLCLSCIYRSLWYNLCWRNSLVQFVVLY